jgi:hypothetical protein
MRNSSGKCIESIKANIGKMQEYRQAEIKKIAELWNEVINLNVVPLQPTPLVEDLTQRNANLNLIENNSEEKYYGFAMRKTKIPPKTMQRVQISQMVIPVNDNSEIWFTSPSEEIPVNLFYGEQIILYEKGEGFIWLTYTHENYTITVKRGTCLVEIQVIFERELDEWKNSKGT